MAVPFNIKTIWGFIILCGDNFLHMWQETVEQRVRTVRIASTDEGYEWAIVATAI